MIKGINSNAVIIAFFVMVISCSASRTGTIRTYQDLPNKNVTKKLDSVPANQLKQEEKELKNKVSKVVNSTNKTLQANPDSERILQSMESMNTMMVDMFNKLIRYRSKSDSLEWASKRKDAALDQRDSIITNLVKAKTEEQKIGQIVKEQIDTVANVGLKIVAVLFGVLGIMLFTLNVIKKNVKQKVESLKQENA